MNVLLHMVAVLFFVFAHLQAAVQDVVESLIGEPIDDEDDYDERAASAAGGDAFSADHGHHEEGDEAEAQNGLQQPLLSTRKAATKVS